MDLIEEPQVFFFEYYHIIFVLSPSPWFWSDLFIESWNFFFTRSFYNRVPFNNNSKTIYTYTYSLVLVIASLFCYSLFSMTDDVWNSIARSVRFLAQCASAGLLLVCSVGTDYFNDETLERRRDSNIPTRAGSFSRLDAADHIGLDNEDPFSVISFFIKSVVD